MTEHIDQFALGDIGVRAGRGLQGRLYGALREVILSGRLAPGSRLPSTRALAAQLGVARQTVVLAYERLVDEGYAAGRVGAGTYVAAALQTGVRRPPSGAPLGLSAWGRRAVAAPREVWSAAQPEIDLRPGVPDWAAFPHTRWRRLLARRWRNAGATAALGQYGDPAGFRPLRAVLAAYLARSRGLHCTADQVLIVSGSQQAVDLLARVWLNPGDVAAVEEPGYPPARAILSAAGVVLRPVPVDGQGLVVSELADSRPVGSGPVDAGRDDDRAGPPPDQQDNQTPRLVYVTPSHQYPTGATLSLARRLALLEWAEGAGALIVEDDYDSELRYAGPTLPALQGLDERGRVAYVGSCSSVLFPPLRVGWIVAPPALVEPLVAAKWLADRQTPTLDQQVLADFIAGGDFARHVRRSRGLYAARRAALAAAVQRHLAGVGELAAAAAGLQTPLYLPYGTDEGAVVRAAAARGVAVAPLGPCRITPPSDLGNGAPGKLALGGNAARPGLLLGFAAVPEAAIEEGVRRLASAI